MNWISKLFKKEKTSFPEEYFIVTYNGTALRNGIEDNANKIVIRYKYNKSINRMEEYKIYGYSDSVMHNLRKVLKIPGLDKTIIPTKMPVFSEINLDEVAYKKG